MQTIIVLLNPDKLANPDLDLRYIIPDRIEKVSDGLIQDDGYDYVDAPEGQSGPLLGIWLRTESASENWPVLVKLFEEEKFMGNDLSVSAEILISENDAEAVENCTLVFPKQ